MYVQDEWRVGSRLTLNLGLRYDLQFIETVNTDSEQPVAARRVRLDAVGLGQHRRPRQRRPVLRPRAPAGRRQRHPLGGKHDRPRTTCSSRACRGSSRRRRAPRCSRTSCRARILTTTLVDFATMNTNLQNAYSKQASLEVERALGAGRTVSVGYQYLRGDGLLMSINQNVPTCVAAGTNNGCRPEPGLSRTTASTRRPANRTTTACTSRSCSGPRVVEPARHLHAVEVDEQHERVLLQLADRSDRHLRDWGRSDDDQRHRLVINGTVNTSMAPATTAWERLSHGFQLSAMLQVLLRRCRSTSRRASRVSRARTAGRWRTVPFRRRTSTFGPSRSSTATPASAATSSHSTCG